MNKDNNKTQNNNDYDYEEFLKKYFGYGYLDINKRLEILHNNMNWYLEDNELNELLEKTSGFGRGRKENWKYKIYIKKDYDDYIMHLKEEVKKNTSLSPDSDAILLWANHKNILYKITGETKVDEKIKDKNFNKYDINNIKEIDDIKNLLENEYLLLDTETTGFNSLNQIIEFGGIIYNRQVDNSYLRLKEVLKIKNIKSDKILSIFKYIDLDFLHKEGFFIIENYSKLLKENLKYKKTDKKELYFNLLNEFSDTLKDHILIDKKEFDYYLILLNDFRLTHNRKIHFYIKPYKDYVTDMTYDVHHISNDLIMEKGIEVDRIGDGLYSILENQNILAHNVGFDMNKIVELFHDLKLKIPNIKGIYDTINIFQALNNHLNIGNQITKYNLDYLSKVYLGVDLNLDTDDTKDRHTAIFDVKLTKSNIDKILKETNLYINNIDLINQKEKEVENKLKEEELKFLELIKNNNSLNQEIKDKIKNTFHIEIINKILEFNEDTFVYNELNHLIVNYITNIGIENEELKQYLLKQVKEELYKNIEEYLNLKKENKNIQNYFLSNINKLETSGKKKNTKTSENNLTLF